MTITETTPVGDIAAAMPSSVRVFQRLGIDFCCGGRQTLRTVCDNQGLSLAETVAAIEASAPAAPDDRDWTRESLSALTDYIVATYHTALREELPRLQAMASKVAHVHGAKSANLAQVDETVTALSTELKAHMAKEETVLFPAICGIEAERSDRGGWIAAPISVLEHEHDHAGELLARLRQLTDGYTPPEWGCATMRALYHGLEELEAAMHVHVHLENNVLFPRALRQSAAAAPR